jgi:hypothetical protein
MHFSSEDTILLAAIGSFNFEFGKKMVEIVNFKFANFLNWT